VRPVERVILSLTGGVLHSSVGIIMIGVVCVALLVGVSLVTRTHYGTLRWYRWTTRSAIGALALFALWGWLVAIPVLNSLSN
jgi:hypothetical protein